MAELQAQGAIERIGVSNVTPEQLARAGSVATIDAVQNLHSAVGRESADVVLACERAGIAFFAYSPLRSDVALDAALPRLAAQASLRGVSVARLAIRALLASSPALSVVSGASRIETVRDAAAAPAEPWDADAAAAYREDLAAADGQER